MTFNNEGSLDLLLSDKGNRTPAKAESSCGREEKKHKPEKILSQGRIVYVDIEDRSSGADEEIQPDPNLLFDYCELCDIKCDPKLPHLCDSKWQQEQLEEQSYLRYSRLLED
jgi:hypothetical protein